MQVTIDEGETPFSAIHQALGTGGVVITRRSQPLVRLELIRDAVIPRRLGGLASTEVCLNGFMIRRCRRKSSANSPRRIPDQERRRDFAHASAYRHARCFGFSLRPGTLSRRAARALETEPFITCSIVNFSEIGMKLGRVGYSFAIPDNGMALSGFSRRTGHSAMPISPCHCQLTSSLPSHDADPFDRCSSPSLGQRIDDYQQ